VKEKKIVILGTNDIHGSVDQLAWFGGIVRATREGLKKQYGDHGGVLVLDGGDQFQGTLLSNFSEGRAVFDIMSEIGYDGVVPGNHDYDFGPKGWLEDKVGPDTSQNPREVIEMLAKRAAFPLLSANTYFKDSLKDLEGRPLKVEGIGCLPAHSPAPLIDWSQARSPDFLKPYILKEVAGVRVAVIGLDHTATPVITTPENVSDLCFADEIQAFNRVKTALRGQADVFVVIIHQGDSPSAPSLTKILQAMNALEVGGPDAVIAGHTHMLNRIEDQGVYAIQSGANGERFGWLELTLDLKGKILKTKTQAIEGISIDTSKCDARSEKFCSLKEEQHPITHYLGERVNEDPEVATLIREAHAEVAPISKRVLGELKGRAWRHRINESPMANLLTDGLRDAAQVDVAFLNTGGIRNELPPGPLTYEAFYRVQPFNNRAVILEPLDLPTLKALLENGLRRCGQSGGLMQSGLRITFERDCKNRLKDGIDPQARLLSVSLADGTKIFDQALGGFLSGTENVKLRVATLDFLAAGGSGFSQLKGLKVLQDLGIFREIVTEFYLKNPGRTFEAKLDSRFVNVLKD
jgi:5'-nucleotidase